MLQHASMALVETECNAVEGWPVSCKNQRACAHWLTGRSSGRVWPDSKPLYRNVPLCPSAGIVASDAPNFPDSPLITNVRRLRWSIISSCPSSDTRTRTGLDLVLTLVSSS